MHIDKLLKPTWLRLGAALVLAVSLFGSYSNIATAATVKVTLAGDQELPPVKSAGTGTGTIMIGPGNAVSGSVVTTGISGTAGHIHVAEAGKSGPVIIELTKNGDTYTVPEGTKLTDSQLASFKAGKLYVNVHSAANEKGEMRGQLKP